MGPFQPIDIACDLEYLNGDLDWDFDPNLDCLVEPTLLPETTTAAAPMDFPYTKDSTEDLPFVDIKEAQSFGCSESSELHIVKSTDSTDRESLTSESSQESLDQIFRRVQRRPAVTVPVKRTAKAKPVSTSRRGVRRKPKDMPKRPLSGYNFFFQVERKRLFEESNHRIGFTELGRLVGQNWRSLPEEELHTFELLAAKDVVRYKREMKVYENARRRKYGHSTKAKIGSQPCSTVSFARTTTPSPSRVTPPLRPLTDPVPSRRMSQYVPPQYTSPRTQPVYSYAGGQQLSQPVQHIVPAHHYEHQPMPVERQPQYQQVQNVQYACYRMTRQEAQDYMRQNAGNGATVHQPL